MSPLHYIILALSCTVITAELGLLFVYWDSIINWLSHNLWVVIIPFAKTFVKRLVALKLLAFFKALMILVWHLLKLLLLKFLKTLGVRYGVFFSQNRWYWIRRAKVMFLRRGKQFFRATSRFWRVYSNSHQWIILIAFFPIGLLLFLLGLSFNVTRKTMVQKTQETAIFKAAATASNTSRGIRAWLGRLDRRTLDRIRDLTPRARALKNKQQK